MPPSKRLQCDDPEWTRRKTVIKIMYVDDRLSQKKIRDKLEEDGFRVTKSELEAQLHFWNMRKNASANAWRYIDYRLRKREQQTKESVVYYNGKKVSRNTLKKERGRYQPDTLTKYMTAVSPKTPEGMELCVRTPTPAPMQSTWVHTLPWIRFQIISWPSISAYLTNRMMTDNEPEHLDSQARLVISPLHRQFNGNPFRGASDFAANVASMMPEDADDEIANSAQIIVQGATEQAFNEHIRLILYCLSNNMYRFDRLGNGDASFWLVVVKLIERSGLTKQPLDLAQEMDATVASIAENSFKCCIEFKYLHSSRSWDQVSNSKVISWLLKSGQSPDVEVYVNGDSRSPLQFAARNYDFELAMELLDAGADPDKSSASYDSPLLDLFQFDKGVYSGVTPEQRENFKGFVLRLLEAGASLHEGPSDKGPSALMWAVYLDLQVANMLIQRGANVEHQVTDYVNEYPIMEGSEFTKFQSVMGFAMYDSDEAQAVRKIRYLVGHVQRSHPSTPVADLLPADVLCLAAYFGFDEVIKYCCSSPTDKKAHQDVLFSALCAASCSGRRETCELLLKYGAPINGPARLEALPSPLHFAALMDDAAVVELLCERGADVNVEFKGVWDYEDHPNLYMWNRVLEDLRNRKIRFWETVRESSAPINPLGAAIIGVKKGIPRCFETLIQYGAKLPHWAVYHGARKPQQPELINFAMKQGGNFNWRGPDGRTPLQSALLSFNVAKVEKGYWETLEFDENDCLAVINSLIDAGADTTGSEAELVLLLKHSTDFDKALMRDLHDDCQLKTSNLSVMAAIILSGSIPRIERALANHLGAYDPGALCASVMLAISSNLTGPLEQLIFNRPSTIRGTTQEGVALGLAAWYDRLDILDMLLPKIQSSASALIPVYSHTLKRKVSVPSKNDLQENISESFKEVIPSWFRETLDEGELLSGSPLVFSTWSQECLDKLLQNNFKPDRLTLSVAICHGDVELLEKLVHGAWNDDRDSGQPGPLYWSVARRLGEKTTFLLSSGFSPNECNESVTLGRSPLQKAVEDGNLEMIDLLLESGADVNAPAAKSSGATALQLAAIKGRLGIERRLIELGANVNALGAEEDGRTALEGAAEHGRLDMVQLLLDCGANVAEDGCLQYFKAIKFAEEEVHMVVANVLKTHREWTSYDEEMWELINTRQWNKWAHLTELDRSSLMELKDGFIDGYIETQGSEETVLVDMDSDDGYNGSQDKSAGEGRIRPKEAVHVDGAPGEFRIANEAMASGTDHDTAVSENPGASLIAWNQQLGNPTHGFQSLWDEGPMQAVHDAHTTQGFELLGVDQLQLQGANQGLQATWESMPIGSFDNNMSIGEQLFPAMGVESEWDQHLRASNWDSLQNWVGAEKESGICYEAFEGDIDWAEA